MNPEPFYIVGISVSIAFWVGYKFLQKNWIMIVAIIISSFMAFIAYNSQGMDSLQMKGGYAANWFYSPALFLIIYTLFKYLFKIIFKNEPIMSGYLSMSYEQGEYRKLHAGDAAFTVITLVLPMIIPMFI